MDINAPITPNDFSRIGGDLLQLAYSMEQLNDDVPVASTPQAQVDKKAYRKTPEKKIAQGHKADDNGEQDFTMKIGGY